MTFKQVDEFCDALKEEIAEYQWYSIGFVPPMGFSEYLIILEYLWENTFSRGNPLKKHVRIYNLYNHLRFEHHITHRLCSSDSGSRE